MTLDEAMDLARSIELNSAFAVVAIGRFVMVDELDQISKQTLRWGVSVISLVDREDRSVCFSEADWVQFARSHTAKPAAKKAEPTASRATEEQLSLF